MSPAGNPPRFAWATPFGLHPASVLARLAAGAGVAGVALDLPLPLKNGQEQAGAGPILAAVRPRPGDHCAE